MKVTSITVGRLFNLGNYENVKYEVSVDLGKGDSAAKAMIGLERIFAAMAPESRYAIPSPADLRSKAAYIEEMKKLLRTEGSQNFRHRYGLGPQVNPRDYIRRHQEELRKETQKRANYIDRNRKARELLDKLASSHKFTDAKLSWDDTDCED